MKKLGPVNALYPMPTTLVGALVKGKPNFITIAHVGIMNHGSPQYISLGSNKAHYTNAGILENKAFSVCLPSEALIVETDYCGLVSGKKTDKSDLFELFYGELKTAPMIRRCPVCIESRLSRTLDFNTHDMFIPQRAGLRPALVTTASRTAVSSASRRSSFWFVHDFGERIFESL